MAASADPHRFPFAFDPVFRLPALAFGITESSAVLTVTDDELDVRFGRWHVSTPRHNVVGAQLSGPYSVPKVIGPAHLSLRDKGLTFATNPRHGACLTFREPITGIDPFGRIRHPGLTVTVADPEGLVDLLTEAGLGEDLSDELRPTA